MTKTVSAYEARTKLGEIMNLAYYKGIDFIVKRRGEPVVKIVRVGKPSKSEKENKWKAVLRLAGAWDNKDGDIIENNARRLRRTGKIFRSSV